MYLIYAGGQWEANRIMSPFSRVPKEQLLHATIPRRVPQELRLMDVELDRRGRRDLQRQDSAVEGRIVRAETEDNGRIRCIQQKSIVHRRKQQSWSGSNR